MFLFTLLVGFIFTESHFESDKKMIQSIIIDIVKSAEDRDPSRVEGSFHKDYSQYLDFMGKGIGRSTKKQYQEALRFKKIGGEPLDYEIKEIQINKDIAFANVQIESKTISFFNYLTFMKENRKWLLVQRTLRVEMKAKN